MEKRQLRTKDVIKENQTKLCKIIWFSSVCLKKISHMKKAQKATGYLMSIQVSKDVTFLERDPHSSKETQCDGDLFEDQLSEADEENATSSLIENHPEREITDQNL